jgi:hypothetical protein
MSTTPMDMKPVGTLEDDWPEGFFVCTRCGAPLILGEISIINHQDLPRALVSFLFEPTLRLGCILDGPHADERGVIGAGIDENGVEGEVYGDYAAGLEPGDEHRQGIMFELECPHCTKDINWPDGSIRKMVLSSTFEIRFEAGKTRFYRDPDITLREPPRRPQLRLVSNRKPDSARAAYLRARFGPRREG